VVRLLGDDIRIAVELPYEYDDLVDVAAIRRWTTVALHPGESGWLRKAPSTPRRTPTPTTRTPTRSPEGDGSLSLWRQTGPPGRKEGSRPASRS
jgi:hypothetical protein